MQYEGIHTLRISSSKMINRGRNDLAQRPVFRVANHANNGVVAINGMVRSAAELLTDGINCRKETPNKRPIHNHALAPYLLLLSYEDAGMLRSTMPRLR